MKKSTKIILIIAVSLLGAGLVLTLIGHLLGASYSQIIRGDLWVLSSDDDHESGVLGGSYDNEFSHDNTYEVDPDGIDQLSVDWVSGDIRIQAYDGDQILIQESCKTDIDDETCLRYRVKNGSLDITCCREKTGLSFHFLGGKKLTKKLVIKVPRALAGDLKELDADVVSSDLTVSGLTVRELTADSVSGDVTLNRCSIAVLETDTVSGDILLSLLTCPKTFDGDTTSGSIDLKLPEDSSFDLEFDTVSGEASIAGFDARCLEKEDGYEEYRVGEGGSELSIGTTSGDLTVTRAEHH